MDISRYLVLAPPCPWTSGTSSPSPSRKQEVRRRRRREVGNKKFVEETSGTSGTPSSPPSRPWTSAGTSSSPPSWTLKSSATTRSYDEKLTWKQQEVRRGGFWEPRGGLSSSSPWSVDIRYPVQWLLEPRRPLLVLPLVRGHQWLLEPRRLLLVLPLVRGHQALWRRNKQQDRRVFTPFKVLFPRRKRKQPKNAI